jgi:hypothetical protein
MRGDAEWVERDSCAWSMPKPLNPSPSLTRASTGFVAAAAKKAHQAEQIAEVVPGAVIVDFVDIQAVEEQGDDEYNGSHEALPESEPESGDGAVAGGCAL